MSIPLLTYPTSASNTGQTLWSELAETLIPNGIIPGVGNQCNVYGDSTGLNVKADIGRVSINGFWADIPSLQTVSGFASPDASNNRIDRVVARLDTTSAALISLVIVPGTPSSSPALPAIGSNDMPLAQVTIRKLPNATIASTDVVMDHVVAGDSIGPLAELPAVGQPGRSYAVSGDTTASNNGRVFYDTGSVWNEMTFGSSVRIFGTLDGAGNGGITHGFGATAVTRLQSVLAFCKGNSGEAVPIGVTHVDGGSVAVTGGIAGRIFYVSLTIAPVDGSSW